MVVAYGHMNTCQARILVDTGSQKTFVTQQLKRKLKLEPIKRETLDINTFGTTESTTKAYDVVSLSLKAENEKLAITALVTPTICPPLSNNTQGCVRKTRDNSSCHAYHLPSTLKQHTDNKPSNRVQKPQDSRPSERNWRTTGRHPDRKRQLRPDYNRRNEKIQGREMAGNRKQIRVAPIRTNSNYSTLQNVEHNMSAKRRHDAHTTRRPKRHTKEVLGNK